jgi:hypothetical protein
MVITRMDWRLHGDLLEYLALEYPGRPAAAYEAAFRLLTHDPNMSDEVGDAVELLLAGCVVATEGEEEQSQDAIGPPSASRLRPG